MKKPSILHSNDLWLPLTQSWLYDQIRFLAPYFSQTIWCDRRVPWQHEEWTGQVIEYVDSFSGRAIRTVNNLLSTRVRPVPNLIGFETYDVLFSHFGCRAWYDSLYFPRRGGPRRKVVRFYGHDLGVTPRKKRWRRRYRTIFDLYDVLLCEGPFMAQHLGKLQAPPEKIHWLPLGVDPAMITTSLTPLKHLVQPLTMLIAATFTEKKGIEFALQAILEFVRQEACPVALTVVGDANPANPEQVRVKQRLAPLFDQLRRTPLCQLTRPGYVPLAQLQQLMRKHLLFLAPSVTARHGDIEGGFPVSLTHAAAQGMILIGTDHCDLPQIIRHQHNGYLCRQRSVADLVHAFRDLIASDSATITAKRHNSRALVQREFNAVTIAARLAELIGPPN